jgi:hypothetical protein
VAKDVNWGQYFYNIRQQCPWSYKAWQCGEIDIQRWQGSPKPLGVYQARIYIVDLNRRRLKKLAGTLDLDPDCEWLFSEPSYGPWATAVPVLIQQDRHRLNEIRQKLNQSESKKDLIV